MAKAIVVAALTRRSRPIGTRTMLTMLLLQSLIVLSFLPHVVDSTSALCAYKGGSIHMFQSPKTSNGTDMTLDAFSDFMGPLWTGFFLCNRTLLEKSDLIHAKRRLTSNANVTVNLVKRDVDQASLLKNSKIKNNITQSSGNFEVPDATQPIIHNQTLGSHVDASHLHRRIMTDEVCNAACRKRMNDDRKEDCKTKSCKNVNEKINDTQRCKNDIGNAKDEVDSGNHFIFAPQIDLHRGLRARGLHTHDDKSTHEPLERRAMDIDPRDPYARCIPLVSRHPSANPYHVLLTGMKDSNVRVGGGYPHRTGADWPCASSDGQCDYTQTYEKSVAHTTSVTISTSDTETFTSSDGKSWNSAKENTFANAITDAIDKNWQTSLNKDKSGSIANEVSKQYTKSHERSTAQTRTTTDERSTTDTRTWNTDEMKGWSTDETNNWSETDETNWQVSHSEESNWSNSKEDRRETNTGCTAGEGSGTEVGASAGINAGIFQASVHGSITGSQNTDRNFLKTHSKGETNSRGGSVTDGSFEGGSHSSQRGGSTSIGRSGSTTNSWGGSQALTRGHTEADSRETRVGDTVSDALTNGVTRTGGWSIGSTDAHGGSASHTIGLTSTRGITDNQGGDTRTDRGKQNTKTWDHSNSTTVTITQGMSIKMTFQSGQCRYSVCAPKVVSVAIPWMCKSDKNQLVVVTTEVQETVIDPITKEPICVNSLAPCTGPIEDFLLLDDDAGVAATPDAKNVARMNAFLKPPKSGEPVMVSVNRQYKAVFLPGTDPDSFGSSFAIMNNDVVIWQTGLHHFGGPSAEDDPNVWMDTRVRLTSNGRLIQEARNFYPKNRNKDDWNIVWSSVPGHLDYTVGVYSDVGYMLILENTGNLVIRDGVGSKIWSSSSTDCAYSYGFKWPIETRYPLHYDAPEPNFSGQIDPHNSIPSNIQWIGSHLQAHQCDTSQILHQNQGLRSPNGRFSIYLTDGGNLILKDYTRTIWSSKTKDVWYTQPDSVYHMLVTDYGQLVIRDHKSRLIWQTFNNVDIFSGPYLFGIYDLGDAGITAAYRNYTDTPLFIWQTQPADVYENTTSILFNNLEVLYPVNKVLCFGKCGEKCNAYEKAPRNFLKNLASNQCLGPNGTAACDNSANQKWVFDEQFSLYRWSQNLTMCLGHNTTVMGPCSLSRAWSNYPDGSMNLVYRPYTCLFPDGISRPCDNPRMDKRWSFGERQLQRLESNGSQIMLPGETLIHRPTNATVRLLFNGDLQLYGPKKPIPATVRNNIDAQSLKKYGSPSFQVNNDGTVSIVNLMGTRVYKTLGQPVRPAKDDDYFLGFNPQGTKLLLKRYSNPAGQSTWSMGYDL
ncbi:hypothetical protein DFJ77DRAFT_106906 [Powellomyces hirtus]|nr:hypothetical protein DFJ77DRAFT_106906 [Powellomyces hirtus]